MKIETPCKTCGQTLAIPAQYLGRVVFCPVCATTSGSRGDASASNPVGITTILRRSDDDKRPDDSAGGIAQIECPSCHTEFYPTAGYPDWIRCPHCRHVFRATAPVPTGSSLPAHIIENKQPSSTASTDGSEIRPPAKAVEKNVQSSNTRYRGIGRFWYVSGWVGLSVIIVYFRTAAKEAPEFADIGTIACAVSGLVLTIQRLKNIGISGWWSVLQVVPLVNLFLFTRCVLCQEGYQVTRRLDAAGKTMFGLVLGLCVVVLALALAFRLNA